MITRRQILGFGALGAAALVVGPAGLRAAGPVFAAAGDVPNLSIGDGLTRFTEALTQPPVWNQANLATRGLTMKESVHRFHAQLGTTRPMCTTCTTCTTCTIYTTCTTRPASRHS